MPKISYYKTPATEAAERDAYKTAARLFGEGVNKRSVAALARETGIPRETLARWKKKPLSAPYWGIVALKDVIEGVTR